MRPTGRWLVAGGLLVATVAPAAHAAAAPSIDYLYVEANEAGSSGGHAAIRFGEQVFHFQYMDSGLLGISREDFAGFRRNYALLENRTIQVIQIPVSEETFDLVHQHFTRRRLIEHQQVQLLDFLAADRRLLQTFQAFQRGEPAAPVRLEGAGYFFDGAGTPADGAPSWAFEALRERIAAVHGPEFLSHRLVEADRQIDALDPRESGAPPLDIAIDRAPPAVYGFAQRYTDAMAARQALEVIHHGRGLLPGSTTLAASVDVALRDGEARAVDGLMEALRASLVRLVRSPRPDWGSALLVGLARLEALEQTRRSGSWVFLDVFPADAPRLDRGRLARRPDLLAELTGEARADFERARVRIVRPSGPDGGFPELDFAELEAAGNRLSEAWRAGHEGRDLRLLPGRQAPSRSAPASRLIVPPRAGQAVDEYLKVVTTREANYGQRLQRLYEYHLLTRNCVTEIFREIDRALANAHPDAADAGRALREASQRRLGGHLEMNGLRFIPAVSAAAVIKTYRTSPPAEIPSHRRASLARLYRQHSALRVFLQESNTLTSTLYERPRDDSYFLFFTDDVVVARPLFGAANLVTGLGATVAGLATLPFDRGRTLWAGLKGVAFSLPELFFVNIRKGSFDYVAEDRRLE
jgi:hypothetical protein